MDHLPELQELYANMQPCARQVLLELARKYAHRWPAQENKGLRLLGGANLVEVALYNIDNVIDGAPPVGVRKSVNRQKP
jgi:hypothetical protein